MLNFTPVLSTSRRSWLPCIVACVVWATEAEAMFTEQLIEALPALPEAPWSTEVELKPRKLARLLRGFDVRPLDVRSGNADRKGTSGRS